MSGHSKWSTIKHKKAQTDAKKGKEFSKLARLITVSVKEGGSDPAMNMNLRMAVEKARSANMPSLNIERAIKKGEGALGGEGFEAVTYEIYGPSGVALIAKGSTDNKNRTTSEIKNILTKKGGRLGESGSVLWMFESKGIITALLDENKTSKDDLEMAGIEAGVEDIKANEKSINFICSSNQISEIKQKLADRGVKIELAESVLIPKEVLTISEKEMKKITEFKEALEESEDIDEVFLNVSL